MTRADRLGKNIIVKPDMPERFVREEARQAAEAEAKAAATALAASEFAAHRARVEAGESSEDEGYWERKLAPESAPVLNLDTHRSISTFTETTSVLDEASTVLSWTGPPYMKTRRHIPVLMQSAVCMLLCCDTSSAVVCVML